MVDPNKAFRDLDDTKLLALCLYGEARGETTGGKIGVASVIMNRVKKGGWFGKGVKGVILKPKQFSCFNEGDPNRTKLVMIAQNWDVYFQKDRALRECMRISGNVLDGFLPDSVLGATHYKTIKCKAEWAAKMQILATIGNHEFYGEKGRS